jgi:RecA/RadA recombinase
MNFRYFPLSANSKVPMAGTRGLLDAKEADSPPPGNYGIATGGGFFVLDVDSPYEFEAWLMREGISFDIHTRIVATPSGGAHYYYLNPPGVATVKTVAGNASGIPGCDFRGDGGYVVGPGSSIDGVEYDLVRDDAPAPCPPWLAKVLAANVREAPKPTFKAGAVGEGGRNHYISQVAGKLQRSNLLTLEGLKEINERDCDPPLPDREVESIFHSISRYAPESDPVIEFGANAPVAPKLIYAKDLASDMFRFLSDKDLVKGEPTGIAELDALLGGGFRKGELTVTLAEAKTGKNTLWHKLMYSALQKQTHIAYASRELSPETEVIPNLLSLHQQRNYWLADAYDEVADSRVVSSWPLIFSPGYGALEPHELFAWMDACRDVGVWSFWIDHLHYCMLDPEDFKAISRLIRELKSYAKRHQVHINLIVQPKLQEAGMRMSLNTLRGGASIGQALDNLLTMVRERDPLTGRPINVVKVTLEVARSKLASLGDFYLQYNKDTTDFTVVELAKSGNDPQALQETPDEGPVFDRTRAGANSAFNFNKRLS